MPLSADRPGAASNDDQRLISEQLARIREMNMKADEIRAEASLLEAKRRLKEAQRGGLWVGALALSSMTIGAGVVAFGILIGWWLWK